MRQILLRVSSGPAVTRPPVTAGIRFAISTLAIYLVGSAMVTATARSALYSKSSLSTDSIQRFLNAPLRPTLSNARLTAQNRTAVIASLDIFVPPLPQTPSSKIVFASNREGSMQIYVMNGDGSGVARITNSGANDDCPRWSPDGAKILFQSDRDNPETGYMDIYVMNLDGSGVVRLTTNANDDSPAFWSPDGSRIVFQSLRNGSKYQVYSMNADGSNQMNLTGSSSNDGEPSWSPDGTKIAFSSDRDQEGFKSIYVMNSIGTGQQRMTFSSGDVQESQPVWSPDGTRIAFVSTRDSILETWQETGDFEIPEEEGQVITRSKLHINKDIYVMNADGLGQTRLTTDLGNDDSPSWSPDGSKIIFRSDRERDGADPSAQVWVMNPDGSSQTDLSATNDGDYSASWVFDGLTGNGGADGSSVAPDATARPVTITFDTLPINTTVSNQYPVATFSSYAGGRVSTAYDGSFGGSPPNGIIATSGAGFSYWPLADLYVNFSIPVNGLSFKILGTQAGGSSALIDVYVNNTYYTSMNFSSGRGFPGQILPPLTVNLAGITHITRIAIRYPQNFDYWYNSSYALYYDDFTFTPELTLNITNPRISGGLDQTTQSALLGADISLTANASLNGNPVSGGSYSWTFTGPASSNSQTGQSATIRSTDTSDSAGSIIAKATYTLNNVSVTATVNINSIVPTLTSFTGQQGPDLISAPNICVSSEFEPAWWFYRLGCGSLTKPMEFTAKVHAATFISEPSQSGIKYVQAVSRFEKYTERGLRCGTRRTSQAEVDSGWQLDTKDPANLPGYPVHRFNEGNDLTALMVDFPAHPLTSVYSYWFQDNLYIDNQFIMYVVYFAGADPANPLRQRPIGQLRWSWGGLVEFRWVDSLERGVFSLRNTTTGFGPGQATTSMVTMNGNVKPTVEVPCAGSSSLTDYKIDSTRYFVRRHYLDFLGREPDDSGWDFWTSQISQCGFDLACIHAERVHIGIAFFFSSEFIESDPDMANPPGTAGFNAAVYNRKFVYWCYQKYLQRDPHDTQEDMEGWQFWTDDLNSNGDYGHTIDAFQLSAHYRNRLGNN